MRIFLTGATGFIGRHVLFALVERGHEVTCLVREDQSHRVLRWELDKVRTVESEFTSPDFWLHHIDGHDVFINCVGIIRESQHATFEEVHAQSPIAVFRYIGEQTELKKIVQISALGADEQAESTYHRTKRKADHFLREAGVSYVILRPSFVYGQGDESRTFFASLAALPITFIPGDGSPLVQPVLIEDLVRAIIMSAENDDIGHEIVDVGGGEPISFRTMLVELGKWLGRKRVIIVGVPMWIMKTVAWMTDLLGHGPITSDELSMLQRGNHGDMDAFEKLFGFRPVGYHVGLQRHSATWADHIRARLTHLRIPLRASVASIWLLTGVVSILFPIDQAVERLGKTYIPEMLARPLYYPLCIFEIILGLLTLSGWKINWLGTIQLVFIAVFSVSLTLGMPELWLEPFGPVTKNIPLLGATLAMMALEARKP